MEIIHLNEETFKETLDAATGKIIVDFWAPWCGPCRSLGKILESIADVSTEITIYKVDVDECPTLAEAYGVASIPTLLFFQNGQLIAQTVGILNARDILEKFN